MNKVSVIMPVFNCEYYLDRSMGSLLKQTIFDNLEIICIDDGSTDGSFNKLQNYERTYKNIRVVHQENRGVSCARNLGLSIAKGDYIAFFDADDEALPQLYETLLTLSMQYKSDISIIDYNMVFEDGTVKKHRKKEIKIWTNPNDAMKDFLKYNRICANPVDKLFTLEVAKQNSFPEGFAIGEDMYYIFRTLQKSASVVLDSSQSLYLYHIRNGSAMKGSFNKKYIDSVLLANKMMNSFKLGDELYFLAEGKYINEVCKSLSLLYKSSNAESYIDIEKQLKNIIEKYKLQKAVKYLDRKHLVAFILMRISPYFYNYIYNIMKIG